MEVVCNDKGQKKIALGIAIGTFIAILPTPGFGSLTALAIAYLFRQINRVAVLFPFVVFNPLILIPLYYFSHSLGDWIFLSRPAEFLDNNMQTMFSDNLKAYLAGTLILALFLAVLSYFAALQFVRWYKERVFQKRLKKLERML